MKEFALFAISAFSRRPGSGKFRSVVKMECKAHTKMFRRVYKFFSSKD